MNFPFLWELLLGVYFVDQIENATFQHFENLGFGAFSLRNSSTGTSRHPMRASNDFSLSLGVTAWAVALTALNTGTLERVDGHMNFMQKYMLCFYAPNPVSAFTRKEPRGSVRAKTPDLGCGACGHQFPTPSGTSPEPEAAEPVFPAVLCTLTPPLPGESSLAKASAGPLKALPAQPTPQRRGGASFHGGEP